MSSVPTPPAAARRTRPLLWGATAVLGLVLAAQAVLATNGALLTLASAGMLAVAGLAATLVLAHRQDTADRAWAAERERQWQQAWSGMRATANELVRERLPAVLDGAELPPAARPPSDPVLVELLDEAVTLATGAVKRGADREESLRLVVVALARRAQAAAHRVQAAASLLADRHSAAPGVVESCMSIDHEAAQQGRHAQSLAVLCGEWPGQQWQEPLAFVDVVRSAAARIVAFRRVEVTGDPDLAAAAPVVEPLIHLLAEALANATQSSPPSSMVTVAVQAVERGVVVRIDDGGVGMDAHRLEEARKVASGERKVGLSRVGEIPQTGLAVIGHYVRRHGLTVDLVPSPYGGVRVVVLVPDPLVRTLEPAGARQAPPPSEPPLTGGPVQPAPKSAATTASGLPLRRRREEQPAPAPEPAPPAAPEQAAQSPADAARWAGAFFADPPAPEPEGQDGVH
ncbi:ATP-binding protein [Actinocorallia populi]|uniref:ATP-binding protein n=1 Tax=Actinocorallia populi TaxID=2079200 RepID=UPI000D7BB2CB|nr:ATP-binding protein [Actinocorallia populi]